MEALLLLLDVSVLLLLFSWSVRNDNPHGPEKGLFRFKDKVSGPAAPAIDPRTGRRRRK
jgi:hypothetical protein